MTIFERELAGEMISPMDSDFPEILSVIEHAMELTTQLNQLYFKDPNVRPILAELFGVALDDTSTVLPPFYTDFGRNTRIGTDCFIQQGCTFFDRGGITIGDHVFIGPKVNLISPNVVHLVLHGIDAHTVEYGVHLSQITGLLPEIAAQSQQVLRLHLLMAGKPRLGLGDGVVI